MSDVIATETCGCGAKVEVTSYLVTEARDALIEGFRTTHQTCRRAPQRPFAPPYQPAPYVEPWKRYPRPWWQEGWEMPPVISGKSTTSASFTVKTDDED